MKRNRTFWGAFLFGIGMIGMLDGIILHQILQWHSMYMYTTRAYQIVSDGIFHLAVTIVVFVATYLLWKSEEKHNNLLFWGSFLLGAGVFNLVEGIIDHHLLRIHHVNWFTSNRFMYDILFDLISISMILIGWGLVRKSVKWKVAARS